MINDGGMSDLYKGEMLSRVRIPAGWKSLNCSEVVAFFIVSRSALLGVRDICWTPIRPLFSHQGV